MDKAEKKWPQAPTCYIPKAIEFAGTWLVFTDTVEDKPKAFLIGTIADLEALRAKVDAEIARRKAEGEEREKIIADLAERGIEYEPPTIE